MIFITRIISSLIYPLGLFFLLTFVSAIAYLLGRHKLSLGIMALAVVLLFVASNPIFSKWFIRGLEEQFPPVSVSESPDADVAVLLGGTTEAQFPPRQRPDLHASADRIVHAADLFRAGKVKAIIASGGELPWVTGVSPEAERMAGFLVDLGVPRDAIIIESRSRTTYENGRRVADIFQERGFRSGLLVTSARHMPRAMAVFRKAGVPVTASSADVIAAGPNGEGLLAWLPSADALDTTEKAVKERVGYLYYWLKGWV